jgi:RecG-like helicase
MRFSRLGEVLGQRQSGLPDFALASLVRGSRGVSFGKRCRRKNYVR